MKAELGYEGKDRLTGFSGVIMGEARYLTGCRQVCLLPRETKDGKYPESQWFDEHRIEVTSVVRVMEPVSNTVATPARVAVPGGPATDALPREGATR